MPVYPELAALVGSRVPDYRGIFLRGLGSQTSTHYGTVTHSSVALGQLQGDGIREISASFYTGGATRNRKCFGGIRCHRRPKLWLEIRRVWESLLGRNRLLCLSCYAGCWWSPPGEPRSSLLHPGQVTCQISSNSLFFKTERARVRQHSDSRHGMVL